MFKQYKFIYFERDRDSARGGHSAEREERERESQVCPPTASEEPHVGLEPTKQ